MSKLPDGFDFEQCIPTEEDFKLMLNAKKTGQTWQIINRAHDEEVKKYGVNNYKCYHYAIIRYAIIATLLQWESFQRIALDNLFYRSGENYDKENLRDILNTLTNSIFLPRWGHFYDKYKDEALAIEDPEKLVQQAADARKREIVVRVKNPNSGFFRIIEYSMKYTSEDPTKKQNGARMHLYINKKVSGDTYGISVRGSNTFGSNRTELDEPFFATEQEARDFITNIDNQHIQTAVDLSNWRFVISDRPVDYAWDQDAREYIKKADLTGAKKINTVCGPCYMLDKCRFFEATETKPMKFELNEDTVKQGNKWVNKGSEGTHGEFKTKKAADAQRKAMFANGYHEDYSIAEDIEKHDTLNSVLFENNKLKPEVRERLIKIANTFIEGLAEDGIKFNLKDIVFIGSNASYNYTKDSDIDLHLVADVDSLECPDNLYPLLYGAYRALFNKKFDIDFYGIKVELYVEPEGAPTVSNGIYSVLKDTWIKEPTQVDIPEINMEEFNKEFQPWEDRYNELIARINAAKTTEEYKTLGDEVERLITDIYEQRRIGIAVSEYSNQNLLFKEFRNRGYLDNLKELKCDLKAKELSLPDKKPENDFIDREWLGEYLNDDKRYEVSQDLTQAADGNRSMVWPDDRFEIDNIPTNRAEPINKKIHGLDYVEDALVDGEPGWTAKKEKYPHRSHIIVGKIDPHKVD